MNEEYPNLEKTGSKNPFKVPEGYFETLNQQIIDKLDTVETKETQVVSLWDKVKPLVYLAAMFAGVTVMFALFKNDLSTDEQYAKSSSQEVNVSFSAESEEEEMDELYDYIEYQVISQHYREAAFISE